MESLYKIPGGQALAVSWISLSCIVAGLGICACDVSSVVHITGGGQVSTSA